MATKTQPRTMVIDHVGTGGSTITITARGESTSYVVIPDYDCETVTFLKKGSSERYVVTFGKHDTCTCKAGEHSVKCKHTAAARKLIQMDKLGGWEW